MLRASFSFLRHACCNSRAVSRLIPISSAHSRIVRSRPSSSPYRNLTSAASRSPPRQPRHDVGAQRRVLGEVGVRRAGEGRGEGPPLSFSGGVGVLVVEAQDVRDARGATEVSLDLGGGGSHPSRELLGRRVRLARVVARPRPERPPLQRDLLPRPPDLVPQRPLPRGEDDRPAQRVGVRQHPLDPDGGVGAEPQPPLGVEELGRADESDGALLDQLLDVDASELGLARVRPRDGADQAEVGRDELALGVAVVGHELAEVVGAEGGEGGPLLLGQLGPALGLGFGAELVQLGARLDGPGEGVLALTGPCPSSRRKRSSAARRSYASARSFADERAKGPRSRLASAPSREPKSTSSKSEAHSRASESAAPVERASKAKGGSGTRARLPPSGRSARIVRIRSARVPGTAIAPVEASIVAVGAIASATPEGSDDAKRRRAVAEAEARARPTATPTSARCCGRSGRGGGDEVDWEEEDEEVVIAMAFL
ncbi:LOW QUALITY PROTEIN: hypothetical protein ACHAWF_008299 [Thalassiosira exigua]